MNPYDELGVDKDATDKEIKKAYKKKAMSTHPDKGGSEEEFKKTNEAYLVLSDPQQRRKFDETGSTEDDRPVDDTIQRLSALFFAVIQQNKARLNEFDIIGKMLEIIEGETQVAFADIKKAEVEIASIERLTGKITNSKGEDNIFEGMINGRIGEIKRRIENINIEIEKMNKCKAMLEVYECEYEMAEEHPGIAGLGGILFEQR